MEDDLLNIVPCGILVFDDNGTVLSVNATLADLLGYEPQAIQGKPIETILSVASTVFYNTHFFPMIKLHSTADEILLTLITREKKSVPVLSNSVRRLKEGRYENVVAFIPVHQRKKYEEEILMAKRAAERALTENKELQALTQALELRTQQLEKQNQRIEAANEDLVQFSRIISHDLQEPIRKIKLYSNMLSSSANEAWSSHAISNLGKIEDAAERLRILTFGLQEYVDTDADAPYEKVDLNEALSRAVKKAVQKHEFDASQVVSERLPVIDGNAAQLELLFLHLLDNAIQFRQPDKKLLIRVTCTVQEENLYRSIEGRYKFVDHACIVFSDNGIGFENQYSHYVFDLGKKAHLTGKGLGLGLALIRKIVDNHGGAVNIESDPGEGTDVILSLPLSATAKA